jgi:hypothetical protein
LAGAFWQALLYGSRDALVSPRDANTALRLVAHELSTHRNGAGFIETVRAGALRKLLDERFGAAESWQAVNKLWRSAPASPGVPAPNEEERQLPRGPRGDSRNQPRWIRDLQDPDRIEREWLLDHGLGL